MGKLSARKLLVFSVLVFLAQPCFAQFPNVPVVQSIFGGTANTSSPTVTCVFNANITSGDALIIGMSWFGGGTPSISDTLGTTYVQKLLNNSGSVSIAVYAGTAPSSGANTITATTTSSTFNNAVCSEHPAAALSLTVDVSNFTTYAGTPASATTGNVTTTLNNDFLYSYIGGFRNAGLFGTGSGYMPLGFQNSSDCGSAEFKIAGAPGSYNASFSNGGGNDQWVIVLIAFKSNAIAITSPSSLPDGSLSNSYSYTMLADGGVSTYTWTITSGALQSGLSLNASTGAITGTPTGSSNNNITFQVTDGTNTTTKAVTLKIGAAANVISVVQSKVKNDQNPTITFTSNVTIGNLIVAQGNYVVPAFQGNIAQKCTDSLGTVFTPILLGAVTTFGALEMWSGVAPASGADTVSCSALQNVIEIANAQPFVDGNAFVVTINNTGSPITSGSLTTLAPNSILVAMANGATLLTNLTVSAPFTGLSSATNNVGSYDIVTTATGYTVSYTMSGNTDGHWIIGLMPLRPTTGAVRPPVRHRAQVIRYRNSKEHNAIRTWTI